MLRAGVIAFGIHTLAVGGILFAHVAGVAFSAFGIASFGTRATLIATSAATATAAFTALTTFRACAIRVLVRQFTVIAFGVRDVAVLALGWGFAAFAFRAVAALTAFGALTTLLARAARRPGRRGSVR